MPYKDPAQRTEAVRRQRRRQGAALDHLPDDATVLPDPPSREFLLRARGEQARGGNVPAIRLLLEEYRRDGDDDTENQRPSGIVQLASRRAS